jgi:hypothetical protein
METATQPTRPRPPGADDFTRTGAVWVTATGAVLLVVAAAVFVAVRWDQLPEAVKLAVLGGLSGAALLAGRRLRHRLPATGAVLYHLGAFLLPVVAAAVALRFEPGWGALLLIEGVTAAVVFTVLERLERSVVLRASAAVAVVVAALGLGATTGVAPAVTVAGAALAAQLSGRVRLARFWALVAGFAPAVGLAGPWLARPNVLDDLALTSPGAQRLALVGGLLAAAVLLLQARTSRDLALLVAALVSAALGAANTWIDVRPPAELAWLTAAVVFLGAEVAAWLLARDEFLRRPARLAATGAEIAAGAVVAPFALTVLLVAPSSETMLPSAQPSILAAAVVAAGAWLLADVRRRAEDGTPMGIGLLVGSGWTAFPFASTATVVAGVAFGTASPAATAVTLTSWAVLLVLSGRPFAHPLAVWCAVVAVIVAGETVWLVVATAVVGAVTIGAAALLRAEPIPRLGKVSPTRFPYMSTADFDIAVASTWGLAGAALVPITIAATSLAGAVDDLALFAGWVGATWVVALVLDRAPSTTSTRYLGMLGRVAMLGIVPATLVSGSGPAALVTAGIAGLALVDALRRHAVHDAMPASIAGPIAVATAAFALDQSAGTAAVVLAGTALAGTVAAAIVPARWLVPLYAAVGWATVLALPMSAVDAVAFATVLLLSGGALLVVALRHRSPLTGVTGAVVTSLGVWAHLDAANVEATDAYVAPVALALLVAGSLVRRRSPGRAQDAGAPRVGSWTAYGPAIALMGAASLAERFAGGPGAHALVAGAIGTVAVIVGGGRRLAAPLLLGTAVLGAVVVSETMTYTATLPTWAWLACSGAVLLAAGIAMERAEVGPLETGRRVVDVVRDRFA